jgi:hypothetical protein
VCLGSRRSGRRLADPAVCVVAAQRREGGTDDGDADQAQQPPDTIEKRTLTALATAPDSMHLPEHY